MRFAAVALLLIMAATVSPVQAFQSSSADSSSNAKLTSDSLAALNKLYASQPEAKVLATKSKAILVFPSILKAGLIVGGMGGNGVLIKQGNVVGTYNIAAASYGLQAGAQSFAQVMFLTTDAAVAYLDSSDGWSVGVGPSVVVVDSGMAKSMTSQQLSSDAYVFIFGQSGLMAGAGVQGQKITRRKN
jgi:lipid-binding SYLF domain-containing protein